MMSEMLMRFNDQVRGGMKCHYSRRRDFTWRKWPLKGWCCCCIWEQLRTYVEYYCDSLDKPKSLLCYCKTDMEKIGKEGSSKQEEQDGEKPEHVTAMMTTTTTLTRCACMPFYILMKNTQAEWILFPTWYFTPVYGIKKVNSDVHVEFLRF